MNLAMKLVVGMLQDYIYGQAQDLVKVVVKRNPQWVNAQGGLSVPAGELEALAAAVLKALCEVAQHGTPA